MSAMSTLEPGLRPLAFSTVFRAGMRRLASGMSIIASGTLETPVGPVATSVTSLTLEPPTLLVCVALSASAYRTISCAGVLSVNMLGAADAAVVEPFTDPALKAARFRKGNWRKLKTGAPVLATVLSAFNCSIAEEIAYSTHAIFIARVQAVRLSAEPEAPLVHYNRAPHVLDDR